MIFITTNILKTSSYYGIVTSFYKTMSSVNALLEDILENPDKPVDMSRDDVVEHQKKINLYGVVVPSEIHWYNFSVTNWRDKYLQKLQMTGMVGYLHRMCMEYTSNQFGEVVMPQSIYEAFGYDSERLSNADSEKFNEVYRAAAKVQLKAFLQRNFDFNPDVHVRTHFKNTEETPERYAKFQEFRDAMKSPEQNNDNDAILARLSEKLSPEDLADVKTLLRRHNDKAVGTYTACSTARDQLVSINKALSNDDINKDDLRSMLVGSITKLGETRDELRQFVIGETTELTNWTPPVDVFHHFERYLSNHYEQMREVVNVLYNERPDIEFAIQVYGQSHHDEESAVHARKLIQDRVTANVMTLSNEGWYMLGPFKRNREAIDFYTNDTEILKRMAEQQESDARLGEDLMKKRVRRQKEKNIIEAGPDDPGLAKYKDAVVTVENLGAKEVLTPEEKQELADAQLRKEMTEVPSDAIQVDIFKPKVDDEGNPIGLVRDKFYTKAEKPDLKEDAVISAATRHAATQQIQSRSGKVSSLADLKATMNK